MEKSITSSNQEDCANFNFGRVNANGEALTYPPTRSSSFDSLKREYGLIDTSSDDPCMSNTGILFYGKHEPSAVVPSSSSTATVSAKTDNEDNSVASLGGITECASSSSSVAPQAQNFAQPVPAIVRTSYDNSDPHGPRQVSKRVRLVIRKWGSILPIPPERFLHKLLVSRGYDTTSINALVSPLRQAPTQKQVEDYDLEVVGAVRSSNLQRLKSLYMSGKR
jgi:hypothetical protein